MSAPRGIEMRSADRAVRVALRAHHRLTPGQDQKGSLLDCWMLDVGCPLSARQAAVY